VIKREMLKKIFLSRTAAPNWTIFSMELSWDKEIQFYANEVPGVTNGPTPGA